MTQAFAIVAALAALGLGTGCARIAQKFKPAEGYVEPERPNDSCNSMAYRSYVGQGSEALYDLVFVDPVRILPPGAMMTQDYNPTRLNFDLDGSGTITRVWCG